ncbi:MAG: hypothetical protein MJZ07_07155 [Bacteroidales bacterium]|nr:hypothetical protein [Bacteroidales bacterium]
MKRYIFAAAALLFSAALYAQQIEITKKPGKVSKAEVEMSVFEADTSAVALVLWDDREVEVNYGSNLNLEKKIRRTQRFKILKEEGKSYADFEFHLSSRTGYSENISKLSVTTYNLEGGKVVAIKMPKSGAYRTNEADGDFRLNFSAVDVRVGSVFEVTYELVSDYYWDLGTFFFQRRIPVNCADLKVTTIDWLKFKKRSTGYCSVSYASEKENVTINTRYGMGTVDALTETYEAVDLPAMHKDSDVYCLSQYMTAVEYDVTALDIPGDYRSYSRTWPDVDKSLRESSAFEAIHGKCRIKDQIDELLVKGVSGMELLEEIRSMVASMLSWNGESRLMPRSLSEIQKSATGSNADLNAFLGSALNYAGFSAEPVFIRRRSNGIVADFSPKLNAFNVFVLMVSFGDQSVILDASDKYGFYDLLDDEYLVKTGRLVTADGGRWVDLSEGSKNVLTMSVMAELQADGKLKGSVSQSLSGLFSMGAKELFEKKTEEELMEMLENDMSVEVDGISGQGMDAYSSSCKISFDFEQNCDAAGNLLYVPAFIDHFHSKSEFKNPERVYPVEFDASETVVYSLKLKLPEGYAVESLPTPARVAFPQLGSMVQFQCLSPDESNVMLTFQFKRQKSFLGVEEYANLRAYWEYVCELYDSMFVIKKL